MSSPSPSSAHGHWRPCGEAVLPGGASKAAKFVSARTGLRVVLADVGGPVVDGFLCLATEAKDDDGLPHTLEHLVFLGSEQMPYKGVLDLIANRCLSSGTNAWTDTDHTCYTMTTVGAEGFLNMLPVYVEHVLFPTLTESGYVTEVHHVDGEGEDAGVVYCEMQGRENDGHETVQRAAARAVFPDPRCGYRAQTGGILSNLRNSTSHSKVVRFHRDFYRRENLCIIVVGGGITPQMLFDKLAHVEGEIERRGPGGTSFVTPWRTPVSPLEAAFESEVPYPSDEEDNGLVAVAWRGHPVEDQRGFYALHCLLEYLTESSVSPLKKVFVECKDPLCSTIDHSIIEETDCVAYLSFENVPLSKLSQVRPLLLRTLKELVEAKVDMARMRVIIDRRISELLLSVESNPHEAIGHIVIGDFIYSRDRDSFKTRMDITKLYTSLQEEREPFWTSLLFTVIKKPWVVVKGRPSVQLQKEMAEEEASRVQKQVEDLGKEGLEQKRKKLEAAMEENEKAPPKELLESFKVPSCDSIAFHKVDCWNHSNCDKLGLPIPGIIASARSKFVKVWAMLDSKEVPMEKKVYLPLLCEVLLESAVWSDEQREVVRHEDVVRMLDRDLVSRHCGVGTGGGDRFSGGPFSQYLTLRLASEQEKYPLAVDWLARLLHNVVFQWERIRTVAAKMENSIAEMKRDGATMVKSVHRLLSESQKGTSFWNNCLRQQSFLRRVIADLECAEGQERVVRDLDNLRKSLLDKAILFVAADVDALEAPSKPWGEGVAATMNRHAKCKEPGQLWPFVPDAHFVLDVSGQVVQHALVGLGSLESSFLLRTAPGIRDYRHPDLAPLKLYFQYLTQLEGPMWCKIRGSGLSYGYGLHVNLSTGRLVLSLTKSTSPGKAFAAARGILQETLSPDYEWDPMELEAAKSSLIFEEVEGLKSVPGAMGAALGNKLNGLPKDFIKSFLAKIMSVESKDLVRVGKEYVSPLISSDASTTVVVCRPAKTAKIQKDFERIGLSLKLYENLDSVVREMK